MALADHIIFGCYGFWLPNDPRGSWSTNVNSPLLRYCGPATKTSSRRSVAHVVHDSAQRIAAKELLHHEPVRFTGRQALDAAHGFADAVQASGYSVLACAVMPDHMHLVVGRHARNSRRIVSHLKSAATKSLRSNGWPAERPVWAQGSWVVYLDTESDIERAVRYVNQNPVLAGLRPQRWSFVAPR